MLKLTHPAPVVYQQMFGEQDLFWINDARTTNNPLAFFWILLLLWYIFIVIVILSLSARWEEKFRKFKIDVLKQGCFFSFVQNLNAQSNRVFRNRSLNKNQAGGISFMGLIGRYDIAGPKAKGWISKYTSLEIAKCVHIEAFYLSIKGLYDR